MNVKPKWSTAPTWAKWLAQDNDGAWYWYEERPVPSATSNKCWNRNPNTSNGNGGNLCRAFAGDDDWKDTLERRP